MIRLIQTEIFQINKWLLGTLFFFLLSGVALAKKLPLNKITLPPGFQIEVYADNIPNARAMVLGDQGTLFVGSMKAGKVYAISNKNQNKQTFVLAEDLTMPVGVAFHNGSLYVSAVNKILKYEDIETRLDNPPKPIVINDSFPTDRHHGWKFIAFGPDGYLYVPVGAPCNTCLSDDERYASIMRMKPDGSDLALFAKGVRNSVGFDWEPNTKHLWFTDNGSDWMGDDLPPCELNTAPKQGMHFGYPYCHGGTIADPEYGKLKDCVEFTAPAVTLGPHVAPLGMRFYTGKLFPKAYHNKIFIAEHGSWNRSTPIGYRITYIDLDKSGSERYQVFAEGWLQPSRWPFMKSSAWGRPVDVLNMPDGSLLVSDDHAGVIYQISYVLSEQ